MQYSVPRFPSTVTLINTFTHFEVHVKTSPKVVSKLCSQVRQAIFTGLKQATHALGYNSSTPLPAILCPCSVGDTHIATIADGVWTCTEVCENFGDLGIQHHIWEECSSTSAEIKGILCMHVQAWLNIYYFSTANPTLEKLLSFPVPNGRCNLAELEEIGSNYSLLGVLLLKDEAGQRPVLLNKNIAEMLEG